MTWCRHPGGVPLLSLSYALLYLTILCPSGALLTAFLQLRQVPPWQLSLARCAGAALGITGTVFRPVLGRHVGNRCADGLSVCWEAACTVVAALSYHIAGGAHGGVPMGVTPSLVVFMAACCAARLGLYAFELGVLNRKQELVDPRCRSAVGAVDASLTSMGTLAVYGASMYFSHPSQFGLLVGLSSFFVNCAAVTYMAWTALYISSRHPDLDEGRQDNSHFDNMFGRPAHRHHTLQLVEMKESRDEGVFTQMNFAKRIM